MFSVRNAAALVAVIALCGFGGMPLGAQQPTPGAQQRAIDSLAAAMRALEAKLDSIGRATAPASAAGALQNRSGAYMNVSFVGLTSAGWSTASDIPSLQ